MAQTDDYHPTDSPPPKSGGSGLKIVLIILGVLGLFGFICICGPFALITWYVSSVRKTAEMMNSANNMKQIGLALHDYDSVNGSFPAASIKTKDGKPGLSWRVAILTQVQQDSLYRQFKLDTSRQLRK